MNLMEGLLNEIDRNKQIIEYAKEIPTGGFLIMMVQRDIDAAKEAMVSGDIVKMLSAYTTLSENKE